MSQKRYRPEEIIALCPAPAQVDTPLGDSDAPLRPLPRDAFTGPTRPKAGDVI